MREEEKDLTTFITHRGLMRFTTMPYGLVNGPATFNRIMRRPLKDSSNLDNYLDDVLAHTENIWGQYESSLRELGGQNLPSGHRSLKLGNRICHF